MNRHVKKVKSIFIYEKEQTDEVIKSISNVEDNSYIAIYNPECFGIMNATIELFGSKNIIKLYEIFNEKQINAIAQAIVDKKIKQVIFATKNIRIR